MHAGILYNMPCLHNPIFFICAIRVIKPPRLMVATLNVWIHCMELEVEKKSDVMGTYWDMEYNQQENGSKYWDIAWNTKDHTTRNGISWTIIYSELQVKHGISNDSILFKHLLNVMINNIYIYIYMYNHKIYHSMIIITYDIMLAPG